MSNSRYSIPPKISKIFQALFWEQFLDVSQKCLTNFHHSMFDHLSFCCWELQTPLWASGYSRGGPKRRAPTSPFRSDFVASPKDWNPPLGPLVIPEGDLRGGQQLWDYNNADGEKTTTTTTTPTTTPTTTFCDLSWLLLVLPFCLWCGCQLYHLDETTTTTTTPTTTGPTPTTTTFSCDLSWLLFLPFCLLWCGCQLSCLDRYPFLLVLLHTLQLQLLFFPLYWWRPTKQELLLASITTTIHYITFSNLRKRLLCPSSLDWGFHLRSAEEAGRKPPPSSSITIPFYVLVEAFLFFLLWRCPYLLVPFWSFCIFMLCVNHGARQTVREPENPCCRH